MFLLNLTYYQGITDTECVASLNTVWSYMTGGSGVSSLETLVDLAELETGGEMAMEVGDIVDRESVMLRQWLEGIAPIRRYVTNFYKHIFWRLFSQADIKHYIKINSHANMMEKLGDEFGGKHFWSGKHE